MIDTINVEAKYIFLDVVGYTKDRSLEDQIHIINILNKSVLDSINDFNEIDKSQIIYIPTGDGICISLINVFEPFDIHLKIAMNILTKLNKRKKETNKKEEQFDIRISVNENLDNQIEDINKSRNLSGKGINIASRILDLADDNQILVGSTVFDKISQREKYYKKFIKYTKVVKNNLELDVYHYQNESSFYNNDIPKAFINKNNNKEIVHTKLTNFQLNYILTAHYYEKAIIKYYDKDNDSDVLIVLLYIKTLEIIEKIKDEKIKRDILTDGFYKSYYKIIEYDAYLINEFCNLIKEKHLANLNYCFENCYFIIKDEVIEDIHKNYSDFYKKFMDSIVLDLDEISTTD